MTDGAPARRAGGNAALPRLALGALLLLAGAPAAPAAPGVPGVPAVIGAQVEVPRGPQGPTEPQNAGRRRATRPPPQLVERVAQAWEDAIEAIASSEAYGGLVLPRQEGLVPLGPDPTSGLWEFWLPATGKRPERDPAGGRLRMTGDSGIVLILVPGGTFTMGAQAEDPDAPHYDPGAQPDEAPHAVTLDPYFISKFEMTQGQWRRATGEAPSLFGAGNRGGPTHPVERVTWHDCVEALAGLGLVLPTEAQWEFAARGGTSTPWWTGSEAAAIGEGRGGNLLDETARAHPETADWDRHEGWTDGHLVHAPVGSFAPNPYGLHDTLGNVWEWCLDPYGPYEAGVRPGDGLRLVPEAAERAFRGGSYRFGRSYARSALRWHREPEHIGAPLGLRPARALDPAAGARPGPGDEPRPAPGERSGD